MKYAISEGSLIISGIAGFDLAKSCSCGQAFRWQALDDGKGFIGIVRSRIISASQQGDELIISPCKAGDERLYLDYFDLDRDYGAIERSLKHDPRLCVCLPGASGIRVFNQEPFEALISFIISANNNIKRISGIIERLCALCGEELTYCGRTFHAFPKPDKLAILSDDELKAIGTGYRAPYIREAAKRVADGYDLEALRKMRLTDARKELLTFLGVGPKVADCVLLFSLGHTDAFPIDVWIGRAMKELFFDSEPPSKADMANAVESMGSCSGIIQQYIFYYAREVKLGKKENEKKSNEI